MAYDSRDVFRTKTGGARIRELPRKDRGGWPIDDRIPDILTLEEINDMRER